MKKRHKFFKDGNFNVNKSHFPFSKIRADHGIEQLNWKLKVAGGVKGLLQNENSLHFILYAPVLDSVCEDFHKRKNMRKESRNKQYQLTGTTTLFFCSWLVESCTINTTV